MATADELLRTAVESDDIYIIVDPVNRTLSVPQKETIFGVYQDKNIVRKYFKCPRIIGDNIDLSECYIFVNYISSGGNYGRYVCEDVEADNNCITFSWILSANVFDGNADTTVRFAVQAKRENDQGISENVFNTKPATGTTYSTIDGIQKIEEGHADVILQILSRLDAIEMNGGAGDGTTSGASGKSAYEIAVENGFIGTEMEWLTSLKGDTGENGESAYDIAVKNGYEGTEQEWLESLNGEDSPTIVGAKITLV